MQQTSVMVVILNVHNVQEQLIIVRVVLPVLLCMMDPVLQVVHLPLSLTMANAVLVIPLAIHVILSILTVHPVCQGVLIPIFSITYAILTAHNTIMKILLMESVLIVHCLQQDVAIVSTVLIVKHVMLTMCSWLTSAMIQLLPVMQIYQE